MEKKYRFHNNRKVKIPKVGMPVTYEIGTDKYGYIIAEVISPRKIKILRMTTAEIRYWEAKAEKGEFVGPWFDKERLETRTFSFRKNGLWNEVGDKMTHFQDLILGVAVDFKHPDF